MQLNTDIRLVLQLMNAHWTNSSIAESAVLDQVQSYLTEQRTTRAVDMSWAAATFAATSLRGLAALNGCEPAVWILERCELAHRADPVVCGEVIAAIEAELNHPGTGMDVLHRQLLNKSPQETLSLVREAAWLAATVGTRCTLVW